MVYNICMAKRKRGNKIKNTFQERLKEAMTLRGMGQSDLVQATGLSKPRISQYVNGVYEAKQQALYVLAKALNVNISWLMGNDVPMEINYDKLKEESAACEIFEKCYGTDIFEIVKILIKLDTFDRQLILNMIDGMLKAEKYTEKKPQVTTIYRAARSVDNHPAEIVETTKDFSKIPPTENKNL